VHTQQEKCLLWAPANSNPQTEIQCCLRQHGPGANKQQRADGAGCSTPRKEEGNKLLRQALRLSRHSRDLHRPFFSIHTVCLYCGSQSDQAKKGGSGSICPPQISHTVTCTHLQHTSWLRLRQCGPSHSPPSWFPRSSCRQHSSSGQERAEGVSAGVSIRQAQTRARRRLLCQ
jgi:hypothetical protein